MSDAMISLPQFLGESETEQSEVFSSVIITTTMIQIYIVVFWTFRTEYQFKLQQQTGSDMLWERIPTGWGSPKVWFLVLVIGIKIMVVEIRRGQGYEGFLGDEKFLLNPLLDREPLKLLEDRGDAVFGLGWCFFSGVVSLTLQSCVFCGLTSCLYFFTGFGELLWCTHDSQTDPPCYPDQGAEGNAVRQTQTCRHTV